MHTRVTTCTPARNHSLTHARRHTGTHAKASTQASTHASAQAVSELRARDRCQCLGNGQLCRELPVVRHL
eukprot:2429964-Pleurochrysis_carterae.AAC.1